MATGVPIKNVGSKFKPVELSYPCKKSHIDILNDTNPCVFDSMRICSSGNRLYCGNNLSGLRELFADSSIRGKITLVYIDPPFATKGTFLSRKQHKAYEDDLCGADYVEHLRERLIIIRELLSASGSIYLHLDDTIVFEMKLVMDEVFGSANYRNMIVRKKCNPKNYTRKAYGNTADFILFYSKSDKYVWNRPVEPLSKQSTKEYHYTEPETGRYFMKVPVHAPGTRNGATGGPWRGKLPPPGKHWQYTPQTLDEMDSRGEIFWSKNGNPRRKVYLDVHPGVGIQDIWLEFKDAYNQNIKITGYPTEKNSDLLRRIVQASSNPGDFVLDCYAGSGTTLAVADEMQRHWIGMDNSPEAISTILKRFEGGLLPMGDYVDTKGNKAKQSLNQLSLFDTLDDEGKASDSQPVSSHTPITEFSVYIEKGVPDEVYSIVDQWIQRSNMSKGVDQTEAVAVSEGVNFADVCYQLHTRDKKLARIIDAIGPCELNRPHATFDFLVDAIICQQLTKRAADAIILRFRSLFRASRPTPKKFISSPRKKILKSGISGRKYEYILDLAQRIDRKHLRLSLLVDADDKKIRNTLKQVKGIGDWTVDMYLLFGLTRLDVFPVNDIALRKSMSAVYGVDVHDVISLEKIADKWKPYRSVGVWYFYKNANVVA